MIRAEGALAARAGLLVLAQRVADPPGGVVGGGQAGPCAQGVRVIRAEGLLAGHQDALVLADGIFGLAMGEAGAGQAEHGA